MKVATIYGASHGLGLATAKYLVDDGFTVELVGRDFALAQETFAAADVAEGQVKFIPHDLLTDDLSNLFAKVAQKPLAVFYTAGIGRLQPFSDTDTSYVRACYAINAEIPTVLIKKHYGDLCGQEDFYLGCVTSIAGQIVSPLFSVYAASKAATSRLIESVNIELKASGSRNRITDFCPGNFSGSSFSGGPTDLSKLAELALQLVETTFSRAKLFIPDYETVYKSVIERYRNDGETFGLSSYEYKIKRNRSNE
jgi:short-subunit dehydrogenase